MSLKRTSLKRATAPLARRKPLGRGIARLRPKRRQRAVLSLPARVIAFDRTDGRCACGCGRRAQEAHHVFDKARWPELVDEPDNVVALARPCHEGHTSAMHRLPRSVIAPAERLAITDAMRAYLDRTYNGYARIPDFDGTTEPF